MATVAWSLKRATDGSHRWAGDGESGLGAITVAVAAQEANKDTFSAAAGGVQAFTVEAIEGGEDTFSAAARHYAGEITVSSALQETGSDRLETPPYYPQGGPVGRKLPVARVRIGGATYSGTVFEIRDLINAKAEADAKERAAEVNRRRARAQAHRLAKALETAMRVEDVDMPGFGQVDEAALAARLQAELARSYQYTYRRAALEQQLARRRQDEQNQIAMQNAMRLFGGE